MVWQKKFKQGGNPKCDSCDFYSIQKSPQNNVKAKVKTNHEILCVG